MDFAHSFLPTDFSLLDDPEIKRTRKILSIILGVCLTLAVLRLIGVSFECAFLNGEIHIQLITQLIFAVFFTVFHTLHLFTVRRCSELGLAIFAFLMIIGSILAAIGLFLFLIYVLTHLFSSTSNQRTDVKIILAIAMISVLIALIGVFILTIIIGKYTSRLRRLILAKKASIHSKI